MSKVFDGIKNLLIGMATTAKHLTRHNVCVQYPTEKWTMPERSRGIVVLLTDHETGELNCTACMLCARSCPTSAITITSHKDEATKKRVLDDFVVDYNLCCFCGLCEEACNFAAIKMAPKYEFSTWNREDLTWHKDKLQEIGRDVPYEKPERKKPAPAAPKPAAPKADDKPAEKPQAVVSNPNSGEKKTESEKKPETGEKGSGEEQK
ncbi:MAG: NADH-quinone oxidoreductase subunit I [Candidatus Zixiibacteriota bacterium]